MRLRAIAGCLLLWPGVAIADGPALAHVTLHGRTLTLTAQNAPFQPAMIRANGDTLLLTFADLHLGFPLPPTLDVSLLLGPDGWSVTGVRLDAEGAVFSSTTAQIIEILDGDPASLRLTLSVEALAPDQPFGAMVVEIPIEISLRSP